MKRTLTSLFLVVGLMLIVYSGTAFGRSHKSKTYSKTVTVYSAAPSVAVSVPAAPVVQYRTYTSTRSSVRTRSRPVVSLRYVQAPTYYAPMAPMYCPSGGCPGAVSYRVRSSAVARAPVTRSKTVTKSKTYTSSD